MKRCTPNIDASRFTCVALNHVKTFFNNAVLALAQDELLHVPDRTQRHPAKCAATGLIAHISVSAGLHPQIRGWVDIHRWNSQAASHAVHVHAPRAVSPPPLQPALLSQVPSDAQPTIRILYLTKKNMQTCPTPPPAVPPWLFIPPRLCSHQHNWQHAFA